MGTGLRERRRRRAMHTIQERALDLFDARGFHAVTIEEIAAAAEVSPSSVYRWFGTKEGVVVADDFESMGPEELEAVFDVADPVGSVIRTVLAYEAGSEQEPTDAGPAAARGPWRRVRYFFQEPSVRAAVCAVLDRAGQRITPMLAARGGMTEAQARVVANALVFGYFAALEQWYVEGGTRPIAEHVEDGLSILRCLWAEPDEPQPS